VHPPSHAAEPARHWRDRWPLLRSDGWVHVAPLLAVLLFVVIILAVFSYLRIEEARREQEALKRDVEYAQQRLRLRLLERQEQVMRLARDISNREVLPPQFNSRAELVAQYPELQSIGWIDVRRRVTALETRPSVQPQPRWMEDGQLRAEAENGYGLARDLRQPVYAAAVGQECRAHAGAARADHAARAVRRRAAGGVQRGRPAALRRAQRGAGQVRGGPAG
jgi:hypothetical protein